MVDTFLGYPNYFTTAYFISTTLIVLAVAVLFGFPSKKDRFIKVKAAGRLLVVLYSSAVAYVMYKAIK